MTWATDIARMQCTLEYYVTIEGLPYAWGTTPTAPAGVGVPGYATWCPTLALPDTWGTVVQRLEPWDGVGKGAGLAVPILVAGSNRSAAVQAADPMMILAAASIHRGDVAVVTASASAAATTISVDSTTGWAASGTLYCAHEAITYTGVTATSFTGCTRGAYGSTARAIVVNTDEMDRGGPYVADHPLVLKGRIAHIYCVAGDLSGRTFVPSSYREVFAGVVTGAKPDGPLEATTLQIQDLTYLLGRTVAARLPRGELRSSRADKVYVDARCNRIQWGFGKPVATTVGWAYEDAALLAAGPVALPDGWYTYDELAESIRLTMVTTGLPTADLETDAQCTIKVGANDDGDVIATVQWATTTGDLSAWDFAVRVAGQPNSLWPALGFTADVVSDGTYNAAGVTYWDCEGQRAVADQWLPAGAVGKIYTPTVNGPAFDAAPGWDDDAGAGVRGAVQIEDEIVEISAVAAWTFATGYALTVSARGCYGSKDVDHYVPRRVSIDPEDTIELRQVLGFSGCSWPRVALYLMESGGDIGSGYDQGWNGGFAYIPASVIDETSFSALAAGREMRDWCITEPVTLEKWLAADTVLSQIAVVAGYDGTSAYKLRAVSMRPSLEADTPDAHALTSANTDTRKLGWDLREGNVVNEVVTDGLGWDAGAKTYSAGALTWRNGTSRGTYGSSDAVELDVRGIVGARDARAQVLNFAQVLTAAYGVPYVVLDLAVTERSTAWTVELGDDVTITHDLLPNYSTAARGVTALLGRVYEIRRTYRDRRGGPVAMLRVLCQSGTGWRQSRWAPSCYLDAGLGGTDTATYTPNVWSWSGDGEDVDHFAAGDAVRVYNPGNETGAVTRSLVGIAIGGDIEFSSVVALSVPAIMEFDAYGSAVARQKRYVYCSDGDRVVGSDAAFYWGA